MLNKTFKNHLKSMIYSSFILSFILIIIGILFITLNDKIVSYMELLLFFLFLNNFIISIILFIKYKKKIFIPFSILNLILIIINIILYFYFKGSASKIVSIILGISSVLNAIEIITELYYNFIFGERKKKIINIFKLIIEIYFAVELFLYLEESLKTHLVLFGILFIGKGTISILDKMIKDR